VLASDPGRLAAARREVLRLRPHQLIWEAHTPINRVFTLKEGWACRVIQFPDGRRQILSFLLPGDTLCVEAIPVDDYRLPYALRAITNVTLCAFAPDDLSEATLACQQHRKLFARYVLGQLELVQGRLADIGRRRAIGAVAHLILELYERLAKLDLVEGREMAFPLRQEDIADALGLTTAHVNRTLLKLRRLGLIEVSPPKLRVLNLDGLRREALSN
jgi:CRP-like cAMP-binding protein